MITRKSLDHGKASDALNASLADASAMLAKTLDSARTALAQASANGVHAARGLGDDLLVGARRAGRSTQGLIAERPVQAVLMASAAAFILGWIARRARELHVAREAQHDASPRAAKARVRARTSKRADATD